MEFEIYMKPFYRLKSGSRRAKQAISSLERNLKKETELENISAMHTRHLLPVSNCLSQVLCLSFLRGNGALESSFEDHKAQKDVRKNQ